MKRVILFTFFLWAAAQAQMSLYSDFKARQIGDVLQVIIVENANATRESKTSSKSNSDFDMNASTSGNVADFLPLFGGSSSLSTNYNGGDETEQSERLSGRITVRIMEVSEGGTYRIEGERSLEVNGEENVMKLTGFIRGRDITSENAVFSYNVADAEITYKKGGITNAVNQGFFSNIFTRVVGLAMIAAALGYLALGG